MVASYSRGTVPDFTRESYWTVAELAHRLRLNQQTVRNWIDQGSLPAVRIGRRVRVLNSDFERLVAGGADADPHLRPSPSGRAPRLTRTR